MTVPDVVLVGPFAYEVQLNKDAINAQCRVMQRDLLGACDHVRLRIALDPDQAADQMADTLLHEILHAVVRQVGLNAGEEEWSYDREENVICRLTPALLEVLRRNPDLVPWLCAPGDA